MLSFLWEVSIIVDGLLTVAQTAQYAPVSEKPARRLIKTHQLTAAKVGTVWYIRK
ncbi:MAG: helix-turn-helix domain-containing protein [Coriobacteriales bacterium]|jgi:hypothetical protein|nr:helix-turn-helix domain-containing protein [Coriobacteriales bacterium]